MKKLSLTTLTLSTLLIASVSQAQRLPKPSEIGLAAAVSVALPALIIGDVFKKSKDVTKVRKLISESDMQDIDWMKCTAYSYGADYSYLEPKESGYGLVANIRDGRVYRIAVYGNGESIEQDSFTGRYQATLEEVEMAKAKILNGLQTCLDDKAAAQAMLLKQAGEQLLSEAKPHYRCDGRWDVDYGKKVVEFILTPKYNVTLMVSPGADLTSANVEKVTVRDLRHVNNGVDLPPTSFEEVNNFSDDERSRLKEKFSYYFKVCAERRTK